MSVPIKQILEYARLAPSGDNIQPWFFREDSEQNLFLYANHPKEIPLEEYYSKSGTPLGVGMVIENVVLSARHFGFETEILSDPYLHEEEDLIAKIQFIKKENLFDQKEENLFSMLPKRTVNRYPFSRTSLEASHKDDLIQTVEQAGGKLVFIEGEENLKKMGKLWCFHDDFYWDHAVLRRNFITIIRSDKEAKRLRSGIPIGTLGLGLSRYFFKMALVLANYIPFIRTIIRIESQKTAKYLASHSSAFGFIFLPKKPGKKIFESGWEGSDFVCAGRIVQRMWLQATKLGLALQPTYTFVVMVSNEGNTNLGKKFTKANKEMLALLRQSLPQVDQEMLVFVFRIGYPEVTSVAQSPKKNVEDILRKKDEEGKK